MYIFIMCYVHILQYGTATIHSNATQSRLHSYRVRPQRSGTVVMRHNIECTVSTAYIFGFIGITQHGHGARTQCIQISVKSDKRTICQWFLGLRMDYQPRKKEVLYDIFSSCMGDYYVSVQVTTELSSRVGWGDFIRKSPVGLRLAGPWILSECISTCTGCVPTHMDIICAHTVYEEMTAVRANSN